jgi:hypothetical protein
MDPFVKRLLMVSPYFVPMNYVGAKRTLHFCRHLPAAGWSSAVVALPASIERDPALETLVPNVPMFRGFRGGPVAWAEDLRAQLDTPAPQRPTGAAKAKASPPPPADGLLEALKSASDRYTRYLPWSYAGTVLFALEQRVDVVYVSAGPYSGLELGHAVARTLNRPLVVDLRDPWSLEENFQAERSARGQKLVEARERVIFDRSAAIILNTESALDAYRSAYAGTPAAARMHCIRNAFDPALYAAPAALEADGPSRPFRIGYYGHLRANKDAVLFLEALARFLAIAGLSPADVELTTFGERTAADDAAAARFGLAESVVGHPWVPFTRCPEILGRCDVLLDLMGPRHTLQISGKLYDYLACGRPILSVSPNAEVGRILEDTGAGLWVGNDVGAIAHALGVLYSERHAPRALHAARLQPYTAQVATTKLVELLQEASR